MKRQYDFTKYAGVRLLRAGFCSVLLTLGAITLHADYTVGYISPADDVRNLRAYVELKSPNETFRVFEEGDQNRSQEIRKITKTSLYDILAGPQVSVDCKMPIRLIFVPVSSGDRAKDNFYSEFARDAQVLEYLENWMRNDVQVEVLELESDAGRTSISQKVVRPSGLRLLDMYLTNHAVGADMLKQFPQFLQALMNQYSAQKLKPESNALGHPVFVLLGTGDRLDFGKEDRLDLKGCSVVFLDLIPEGKGSWMTSHDDEWMARSGVPYLRAQPTERTRHAYGALLGDMLRGMQPDLQRRVYLNIETGMQDPRQNPYNLRFNFSGTEKVLPVDFSQKALGDLQRKHLHDFTQSLRPQNIREPRAFTRYFDNLLDPSLKEQAKQHYLTMSKRAIDMSVVEGREAEAEQLLELYTERFSDDAAGQRELSQVLFGRKQENREKEAVALVDSEDYAEALALVEQARDEGFQSAVLVRSEANAYYGLALKALRSGKYEAAQPYLDQWLRIGQTTRGQKAQIVAGMIHAQAPDATIGEWLQNASDGDRMPKELISPVGEWLVASENFENVLERMALLPEPHAGIGLLQRQGASAKDKLRELGFMSGKVTHLLDPYDEQLSGTDVREFARVARLHALLEALDVVRIGARSKELGQQECLAALDRVLRQSVNVDWKSYVSFEASESVDWLPPQVVDSFVSNGSNLFLRETSDPNSKQDIYEGALVLAPNQIIRFTLSQKYGPGDSAKFQGKSKTQVYQLATEPFAMAHLCIIAQMAPLIGELTFLEQTLEAFEASLTAGTIESILVTGLQQQGVARILEKPENLSAEYVDDEKFNNAPIPYLLRGEFLVMGVPIKNLEPYERLMLRVALRPVR